MQERSADLSLKPFHGRTGSGMVRKKKKKKKRSKPQGSALCAGKCADSAEVKHSARIYGAKPIAWDVFDL